MTSEKISHLRRRTDALLNEAARIAHIGSFDWYIREDELIWSDEMFNILGLSVDEQPDVQRLFELIHPDDVERVAEAHRLSLERGRSDPNEFRIGRPDGRIVTVYAQAEMELDEQNNPWRMLGTLQDITERKRIEGELQHSAEQYRLVTNAMPALIAYVDAEQRYQFANQGYEDWFGLSPEDIKGKQVREVVGDAGFDVLVEHIERTLAGRAEIFEAVIPDKDGHAHDVEARYVPHFDTDENVKVYSEDGKGSSFKMLLPCSEEALPQEPTKSSQELLNEVGEGTILVVDDEETVRVVAARILEAHGFDVVMAQDGVETFREMTKLNPDVKVLLTSGFNEQEAVSQFTGKGLAGFVQKPFDPDDLWGKVQEVLGD